ncbi:unnamed protein product, partial [Gulo gulo]
AASQEGKQRHKEGSSMHGSPRILHLTQLFL